MDMDHLLADPSAARRVLASSGVPATTRPPSRGRLVLRWLALGTTHTLAFCLGAGLTLAWANNLFDFGVAPATAEEEVTAPAQVSSVDYALQLIRTAEERFAAIQDYECIFLRDEFIDGKMNQNHLYIKVRHEPFSVLMEWLGPAMKRGRKVAWVDGKNDGKMLVKQLITLRMDPQESIKKKESRHTIQETGIKNLITRYRTAWEREALLNLTTISVDDREVRVSVGQREYAHNCVCVTARHPAETRGQFNYYYIKLYFDKGTGLPMKTEVFDWPSPTHPDGQLIERYTYLDLKTNVGLSDSDFSF
ncbi:MAG TPA: DUF1571 domain-containing protein [Gemmatales bacterium]|mgnify:CR=1 FL=1|nr:DUF1571 domain-containing protein [Gemmatales bacterium]HMP58834.1 DUF1571 domain-containing protein [Gemmatales bacterium]